MIIYGSMTINKLLRSQEFHCPQCNSREHGDVKQPRRWFTLYFIPIFPVHSLAEYVECTACNGTYKLGILTYDPNLLTGYQGPGGGPTLITEDDLDEAPDPHSIQIGPPGQIADVAKLSGFGPPVQANSPSDSQLPQIRTTPGRGAAPNPFAVKPATGAARPMTGASKLPKASMSAAAIVGLIIAIMGAFGSLLTLIHGGFAFLVAPVALVGLIVSFIGFNTIKRAPQRVTGRKVAVGGLSVAGASLALCALMFAVNSPMRPDIASTPEGAAFEAADNVVNRKGTGANGNSPESRELCRSYLTQLKQNDELFFTNIGKKGNNDYSGWCEVNGDHCAFLIYVPDYNKFEGNAKDLLADEAWKAARKIAIQRLGPNGKLGVGLRGNILYGAVMTGPIGKDEVSSIPTRTRDEDDLLPYFVKAAPLPPALPNVQPVAPPRATKPSATKPQQIARNNPQPARPNPFGDDIDLSTDEGRKKFEEKMRAMGREIEAKAGGPDAPPAGNPFGSPPADPFGSRPANPFGTNNGGVPRPSMPPTMLPPTTPPPIASATVPPSTRPSSRFPRPPMPSATAVPSMGPTPTGVASIGGTGVGGTSTVPSTTPAKPKNRSAVVTDADIREALAELQPGKEYGDRRAAIDRFAKATAAFGPRDEVKAALLVCVKSGREESLRERAIEALGVWGDADSAKVVIATLNDDTGLFARTALVKSVAKSAGPEAVDLLLSKLDVTRAQGDIADALKPMGQEAEPKTLEALKTTDVNRRKGAIEVLKQIGTDRSLPALREIEAGGDRSLASKAGIAIRAIERRNK